jgi:hypothetical protein
LGIGGSRGGSKSCCGAKRQNSSGHEELLHRPPLYVLVRSFPGAGANYAGTRSVTGQFHPRLPQYRLVGKTVPAPYAVAALPPVAAGSSVADAREALAAEIDPTCTSARKMVQ